MASSQTRLEQGRELQRQGRLAEAEAIYGEILAAEPRNVMALNLAGVLAVQNGAGARGIALLEQAVVLEPSLAPAQENLGLALETAGRMEEAAACFGRVIALAPQYPEGYRGRARVLAALERFETALPDVERAWALTGDPALTLQKGGMLLKLGRPREALAAYQAVLSRRPDDATALVGRGVALEGLDRLDEALAAYDKAIAADPSAAEGYLNRARVLVTRLDRLDEAMACYNRLVAMRPGDGLCYSARALLWRNNSAYDEALADFDQAVALMPGSAEMRSNRALVLMDLNRMDEAMAELEHAIALDPGYRGAHFNKGHMLLQQGRFAEGLPLYEQREFFSVPPGRRWQGEDLRGKTVLIPWEMGFGDIIQFGRYAAPLQERGARVILTAPGRLVRLMQSMIPAAEVVAADAVPPGIDFHIMLMSLPFALGTTVETIPARVPYLAADPARVARWRERVGGHGLRVGIAWQGNTLFGNSARAFDLAMLAPLARIPGVRLISLQKGADPASLAPGLSVETLGEDFDAGPDAFLDTAAVMESLDLIVSCDTSVAHVAGALARPVWLALKYVPEWRWLMGRDDTPWYPSMRLFRQPAPNDWAGVFAQMARALEARAARA